MDFLQNQLYKELLYRIFPIPKLLEYPDLVDYFFRYLETEQLCTFFHREVLATLLTLRITNPNFSIKKLL